MRGREFLNSLTDNNKEIRLAIEKLDSLKSLAINVTSSIDSEPVQSNGSQDKMAGLVAKIVDLEKEINLFTDNLVDNRKKAKEIIFTIPNEDYQNVLYDRYIRCMRLYEIADEYGMSDDVCRKRHSRALAEFEKRYEKKNF